MVDRLLSGQLYWKACTFLILFVFTHQIAFSQSAILTKKINLSVSNKPMIEVFELLEKEHAVHFIYRNDLLDKNKPITVQFTQKPLIVVLQTIVNNKQITISALNDQIIFRQLKETKVSSAPKLAKDLVRDTCYTAVFVYDTIHTRVQDTIRSYIIDTLRVQVYDTIRVNAQQNIASNKLNIKSVWGISVCPQLSFQQLSMPKSEIGLVDSIKKSSSSSLGGTMSVYVAWGSERIMFGTGLIARLSSTNVDYNIRITNVKTDTITLNYSQQYWKYFVTTKYIHLTTGDSVLSSFRDSILKEEIRSIKTLQRQTSTQTAIAKQWCTTWYIGLPLIARSQIRINKHLQIPLQIMLEGLVAIKTNHIMLKSIQNAELQEFTTSELCFPSFFTSMSVGIRWSIQKNISLLAMPTFGVQLTNTYNNEAIVSRCLFAGLSLSSEFSISK